MIASVDEPVPTVLGVLVLSQRTRDFFPGAYIQFLRFAGTSLADPITDELVIDGALDDVLRRIDEKMLSHNRSTIDFTSGPREVRQEAYPLTALQQLVRNAVLHRTYESTNAPVRVSWYDDRIEFINPGGPYGTVTVESFGTPGLTDYRNPNLAEAMRVLGYIQRFGAGIPIARRALAENGNPPPEFTVLPTHITATVRPAAQFR
jgi:ATP-dependent DNA helicase RecG